MAIVKCSECGKDVSNKAENCIYCGAPIVAKSVGGSLKRVIKWIFGGAAATFLVLIIIAANLDDTESLDVATDVESVDSEQVMETVDPVETDVPVVADQVPDKVVCETFDCRVDEAMYIAPTPCKAEIERLSKYDFEWTDKWHETVFSNYMAVEGEPDQAYLVGDKLKFQNGFGAWANMIYICTYDLKANAVVDVGVDQGRL